MPYEPEKQEEIFRFKKGNFDFVIRVSLFKGKKWTDLRKYQYKNDKSTFEGWTRQGIAFPEEDLDDLIKSLQKAKKKKL